MFVKKGQSMKINMALADGEVTKTIAATVYKPDGTTLAGSPFTLTHVAGGFYLYNIDTTGFAEGNYIAVYTVYEDAGETTLSPKYGVVPEMFLVTAMEDSILNKIPNNILLDNDSRLSNLNTIPNLSTSTQVTSAQNTILNSITNTVDLGDGRVV